MQGHHHRTVAIADARSRRHQLVLIRNERISVIGNRGQLVLAVASLLIQSLDIIQHVPELHERRPDLLRRQRVEHVGVIGIRAVRTDNFSKFGRHAWG